MLAQEIFPVREHTLFFFCFHRAFRLLIDFKKLVSVSEAEYVSSSTELQLALEF